MAHKNSILIAVLLLLLLVLFSGCGQYNNCAASVRQEIAQARIIDAETAVK